MCNLLGSLGYREVFIKVPAWNAYVLFYDSFHRFFIPYFQDHKDFLLTLQAVTSIPRAFGGLAHLTIFTTRFTKFLSFSLHRSSKSVRQNGTRPCLRMGLGAIRGPLLLPGGKDWLHLVSRNAN
jgi:hypothetical protein